MPEHTPNKLPKMEVTSTVSTSLDEITATGYVLDSNVENYSVDLESYCQPSQYPDSGIESSSLASGQNVNSVLACQTPVTSYYAVRNTPTFDSQCHGSSVCMLLSDNKSTCTSLISRTDCRSERQTNDSAYLLPKELCSTSQCSQQLALSSVHSSWHAQHGTKGYNQGTQPDPSFDQGYSSHSTGSSNQGQDSQREGSVMEEGSQLDLCIEEKGWSAGSKSGDDNYLHGENELEDLLYHFQNFFQNRFESEFHRYQEAVYGIIQEQQNHVRQIVHTAIREQSSSQKSYTEELLSEDTEKTTTIPNSTSKIGMHFTSILDTDYYIPVGISATPTPNSSAVVKDEVAKRRLLDLYSLSCSVSTLLAKTQFKS
ncbi:uncharacterized protein LOC123553098 [Mercenaria mercenaria]|uniref:uncharacterized protein LOC123553098 n=1 Tax=Mercenaria mercenaria TaxID=6596 RepID=UPI00234F437A|nr:uncharacterized protein LOC123553098 [Mercenaria mercenaria]